MDKTNAITALSALAHEHRLDVFRLLVEAGPEGLTAGVIAERLGLAPSSLTFHTQALARAGVVTVERRGRTLVHAADFAAINGLVGYLTENCCGRGLTAGGICVPEAETLAPMDANDPLWPAFVAELARADLPTSDLEEPGQRFFALTRGDQALGFGGFLFHGGEALLRSVVVPPDRRSQGVGARLVEGLLARLTESGGTSAWLLTTTAEIFFAKHGFVAAARSEAPAVIANTREFAGLCPSSATLMRRVPA